MNLTILLNALAHYREWIQSCSAEYEEDVKERAALVEVSQAFTREKVENMSEEDLYNMLAPLWAMRMWGNKHYCIDRNIEDNGLPLLREQFANLLYGASSIDERWNRFRSKVKGIGPAIMSELLCRVHPEDCILWNSKTLNGLKNLGYTMLPSNNSVIDGKFYAELCKYGKQLLHESSEAGYTELTDMLALNYFIWQELQQVSISPIPPQHKQNKTKEQLEIANQQTEVVKEFVHNDVRDHIRDIGTILGFNATIETKVAHGAVVDAVWEAKIGNMGRVIYVFEVQTSGSIDSLLMNLIKASNNKAVQGIVAVSDPHQLEIIKKEAAELGEISSRIKYWDYKDVLAVYDNLTSAFDSINSLGLVPEGF